MGVYSEADIDRQESEGVWCVIVCGDAILGPLAGWVRVVRFLY